MEDLLNKKIYMEHLIRKPDFSMACEHSHAHFEFYYLHTGNCAFSVNNTLYPLSAGDAFLVCPNDHHYTCYEGDVPCERTTIYFYPELISSTFFSEYPELKELLSKSGKIVIQKEKQPLIQALLQKMCAEDMQTDTYAFPLLSLQLLELTMYLKRYGLFVFEKAKQTASLSDDIETVMEYINLNYHLPISLEDAAAKANLSPTYLSKKFRRATGATFKEYLNYVRIRKASQALLTTDDSITQIAADCGFNGSNYFKDIFRKTTGYSPREFRKQTKKN